MKLTEFRLLVPGKNCGLHCAKFTLMVTRDSGQSWHISCTGNDADRLMKDAEEMMAKGSITHYLVARGEYVVA